MRKVSCLIGAFVLRLQTQLAISMSSSAIYLGTCVPVGFPESSFPIPIIQSEISEPPRVFTIFVIIIRITSKAAGLHQSACRVSHHDVRNHASQH